MRDSPLRAVVIGGGLAGGLALAALAESPSFVPVACADPSTTARNRVASKYPEQRIYADAEHMLEVERPDVACVSTPPGLHAEHARLAVHAGARGILLEKPIAPDGATARSLVAELRAAGVAVVIPHGLRVDPTAQAVSQAVRSGLIGVPTIIEIRTSRWDILNAGIHWIDFALGLIDDPIAGVLTACDTSTRTFRDGLQVETAAITLAETTSGARIYMTSGDDIALPSGTEFATIAVFGPKGTIDFRPFQAGFNVIVDGRPRERLDPAKPAPAGHRAHLEQLAWFVTHGQTGDRGVDRSVAALEICEAAYHSNRTRSTVCPPVTDLSGTIVSQQWDPGSPYSGEGGGRDGRNV